MEENRTTGYKNASDRKKRNIICLNVYYTLLLIALCVCYPYMLLHRTSYEKLFGTSDPIISKIIIYTLFGIGILIGYWVFQYAERKRISVETKEKYDNNDDISESFVSTSARREKLKNKKKLYFKKRYKNVICFFGIAALDILLCYLLLMCFDTESIAIIFACSGILIDCFWIFYAERKRIMAKIAQNYDMVSEFSCGLACVGKDGKWGFINRKGDVVIPLKYDSAVWFTEKLAMVEIQGKYGFINKQGLKAISFIFDKATPFYRGKALVEKFGKPFYIDTKGRYVENKSDDAFRLSKEEASALLSALVQTEVRVAPPPEGTAYKAPSPTVAASVPQQKPPAKSHKNRLLWLWIGLGIIAAIVIISTVCNSIETFSYKCHEVNAVFDRMQKATENMNKISADEVISDDEIEAASAAMDEIQAIAEDFGALVLDSTKRAGIPVDEILIDNHLSNLMMDSTKVAIFEACYDNDKFDKILDDFSTAVEALIACEGYDKVSVGYYDSETIDEDEDYDEVYDDSYSY